MPGGSWHTENSPRLSGSPCSGGSNESNNSGMCELPAMAGDPLLGVRPRRERHASAYIAAAQDRGTSVETLVLKTALWPGTERRLNEENHE